MLTKFTRVAAVAICLLSCATRSKYFYAIRDYPDMLQPWLTRVVNTGIVGYDTATEFIGSHATDEEISMLSEAENPIPRTIALYQMTHRPGYNHNQVMTTHLDDTAIIFEDMGEWGIQFWSVTDCVIHNGRWRTDAARDSLANEIILHHDGLRSAYTALQFDSLRPEYHDHITKMILRNRDYRLPRTFYHAICRDQYPGVASAYIEAIASYKTDSCAKILSAILTRKPFMPRSSSPMVGPDRSSNR
jgi:hypothetical protein